MVRPRRITFLTRDDKAGLRSGIVSSNPTTLLPRILRILTTPDATDT